MSRKACDASFQVAQESLRLSRVVRAFGTEEKESSRYVKCLGMLRRISVRQATAYLLYLVTNASLFNLTKAGAPGSLLSLLRLCMPCKPCLGLHSIQYT